MDNTKYLKELQKQGKLPELLKELGLPNKDITTSNHVCAIHLLPDHLSIVEWEKSHAVYRTDVYELNDYMFLRGVKDHDQKKLQTLFSYMKKENSDAYTQDCVHYYLDQKRKRQEAIQAECEKKKLETEHEIGEKINCVLGNKK